MFSQFKDKLSDKCRIMTKLISDLFDTSFVIIGKITSQSELKIIYSSYQDKRIQNNFVYNIKDTILEENIILKSTLQITNLKKEKKASEYLKENFNSYLGTPTYNNSKEINGCICILNKSSKIYNKKQEKWLEYFSKLLTIDYELINSLYATTKKEQSKDFIQILQETINREKKKSNELQNLMHEIRTPFNAIIGFSELLKEKNSSDEEREQYTNIIINSVKNLETISYNYLDQTTQNKTITLDVTPTNLNQIINELFTIFELQTKEKTISLIKHTPLPDNQTDIQTDLIKLIQIFNNLINNAIKFTNKGEINFGYKQVGKKIVAFVEDHGIGIKEENLKSIFDRYKQIKDESTVTYKGYGIGLALCQDLAHLLQSHIHVRSEYGKGTKFYFTIHNLEQKN